MALEARTRVRMQFGDGSAFDEWLSLSLRDTYTDPLGDLKFEAAPSRGRIKEYADKLQKGELVSVYVNGELQGTFIIQTVQTRVSARGGVMFSVSCNTVLITPYQGHIKHPLSFKSTTNPAPVSDILLKAFEPFGFDTFIGDGKASVDAKTGIPIGGGRKQITVSALKQDQATAQENETAYQFVSRIVTRLGVCIHVDPNGKVLIDAPNHDQDAAYDLVQSDNPSIAGDRFIEDVQITSTNDNQFSECRVRGVQSDKAGTTQTALPVATVKAIDVLPARSIYTSQAAAYKPLDISDKSSMSIEQCTSVAKLALGIRAKDAYVIEGEVAGFVSTTGRVWTVNTIANVRIDALDFREHMFVLERIFVRDRNGGDKTRLKLIPRDALVLGDLPSGA